MKIFLLFIILIFPTGFFLSQTTVSGKVSNENGIPLPGVLVVNISTDQKSGTNENGNFEIKANFGDELRFVRKNYERASVVVSSGSYFFGLNITMIYSPTDIEEVIVNPKLSGDLSKDSKSLTKVDKLAQLNKDLGLPRAPEKMREKPADFKKNVIGPLLSTAPAINPQAIYDLLSGKARRQKNLYKFDDFQEKIAWLKSNINPDFFKENNIKETQISDFLNFALLKSSDLSASFKAKNNEKAEFILLGFVQEYQKISK